MDITNIMDNLKLGDNDANYHSALSNYMWNHLPNCAANMQYTNKKIIVKMPIEYIHEFQKRIKSFQLDNQVRLQIIDIEELNNFYNNCQVTLLILN